MAQEKAIMVEGEEKSNEKFPWCCTSCHLKNKPAAKCQACFSYHPNKDDLIKQIYNYISQFKQEHLIKYINEISTKNIKQFNNLVDEITSINFYEVKRLWDIINSSSFSSSSSSSNSNNKQKIEPFPISAQFNLSRQDESVKNELLDIGFDAISKNKCGVIILGGGQGTRLGGTRPKGIVDLGLHSKKTLYQLYFEKAIKVKQLASQHTKIPLERIHLPIYIMTSPDTHEQTCVFLSQHKYFGYRSSDVFLFKQECLPCLDKNGRILLSEKYEIAFNPNGNGGLYTSLYNCGALADMMENRKLLYVQVFGIDNVLAKIGDPYWFGHCIKEKVEVSNKTCHKASAHEKVGVMCLRDGKPSVIEYSEITPEMAELRHNNEHKDLVYGCANLAMHTFSVNFLYRCAKEYHQHMPIHKALKIVPYMDWERNIRVDQPEKENAIKLEYFIFDTFPFVSSKDKMTVFNIQRKEEFSPIKTPESIPIAKKDLSALGIEYILAAGGVISNYLSRSQSDPEKDDNLCEISPLVTYAGEGLTNIVRGKVFQLPLNLEKS